MDIQKAIDLIEKSQNLALLLPPDPGVDTLAAAEALARMLAERGKTVGYLAPLILPHPERFKKLASLLSLPKEFIISLNISESPVSELRYEKGEEKIDVIFSPQSSSIQDKYVSFREGKTICDCALLVGISDIDSASSLSPAPDFFTETTLINLDRSPENKRYGEANLIDPSRSSLSEVAFAFLTSCGSPPPSAEEATLLLTGIVETTKGFRSPETSADTLLAASELIRLGARLPEAFSLLGEDQSQNPLSLFQLVGRAVARSKRDEEKNILWSFLTAEDFEKTGRNDEDVPAVMERLSEALPQKNRVQTLLYQTPQEAEVRAILSGERDILEVLQSRSAGDFQSPCLALDEKFPSFREAEERLALLLNDVLK